METTKELKTFNEWMKSLGYTKNTNEPWLKGTQIVSGDELWSRLDEYKSKQT